MEKTLYGVKYEWDEKAEAVTHNIAKRDICLAHSWVNASLHFGKIFNGREVHVSIKERRDDAHFGNKWGVGYGGIRYCKKCKLIDCIHIWKPDPPDNLTWQSCKHNWGGGLNRSDNNNGAEWICSKCGAAYRFMCGHGGSLYVCDPCYKASIERMTAEAGTLENYLSLHCSKPSVPVIRECVNCEKKIRIY